MTRERAREILGDAVQPDGGLSCLGHYMAWTPGDETATLDSRFTADELEAVAVTRRCVRPSRSASLGAPWSLSHDA
jgi:hypothetical protein